MPISLIANTIKNEVSVSQEPVDALLMDQTSLENEEKQDKEKDKSEPELDDYQEPADALTVDPSS